MTDCNKTDCKCYEKDNENNIIIFHTYNNMLKMCCYHYYIYLTEAGFSCDPVEKRFYYIFNYKKIISLVYKEKIILLHETEFSKETNSDPQFKFKIKFINNCVTESLPSDKQSNEIKQFEIQIDELNNIIDKQSNEIKQQQIQEARIKQQQIQLTSQQKQLNNQENRLIQMGKLNIEIRRQNNIIDKQSNEIKQYEIQIDELNNTIDKQSDQIKQQEETINQLLIALDEKNKTVTQSIIGLFKS